jgi:hypothetical protein
MPELTQLEAPKKRTVDVGIATILAALIGALGAITTAVLATVLPHVTASSPAPVPTVTVTEYASAVTTPAPVVTVTAHPATTSFGNGTSKWVWIAGGGTLLLAVFTLVGFARPAVALAQVTSVTQTRAASKPDGDGSMA